MCPFHIVFLRFVYAVIDNVTADKPCRDFFILYKFTCLYAY